MSCHIFFSIPDANNNVIPFRCALPMWIQRFREMLWVCEDGLCWHWYVLGLIATNTWCKPGHCSSVAVNPLSGVKSEPTAGYLANPPFWTISIFSSPKWGPPLATDHRLKLEACCRSTSWVLNYGSAEGPPRGVENRNLLSHPDDLRLEAYLIRMT